MRALERLLGAGGANGNALDDTPGFFVYPEYQQIYNLLVASGARSPLHALMVGAEIEEMDIADLRRVLTQMTDPQVRQVLERLMNGSQNHLRAFASQIAQQGGSYNAEFLTQAEFNQIAGSSGRGKEQQSAGLGANNSGQGSQYGGNGQQLGLQDQTFGGQRFGVSNQNGQGVSGQGLGKQRHGR